MMALVGQESSFDMGRRQLEILAGLKVTRKAVERISEAIGADIQIREKELQQQAMQLHLPVVGGPPIPIMYAEMDGTGVPVVAAETQGLSLIHI